MRFLNNVVLGNDFAGISNFNHTDGTIAGNHVEDNGLLDFNGNGIAIQIGPGAPPGARMLVQGNEVRDNHRNGIEVGLLANGNEIIGNNASGNNRIGRSDTFDLADQNPACAGNVWFGNKWGSAGYSEGCTTAGTPPQTTITSGPAGSTNDDTPTFEFSADKQQVDYLCTIDGGTPETCASPHTTAQLIEGAHSFEVTAVDSFGGVDPTPAERSFSVDVTEPETTITSGPSGATTDDTPSFEFSSSEAGSSFACRMDGAAFAPCTSPHTTQALDDGPHSFEVAASDPASPPNTDPTPASLSFTLDATAPETTITAGPSGTIAQNTASFEFAASEEASFACRLDAAAFAPCTSPYSTGPLASGPHTFEVVATDAVGNADPTPASRSFSVDLTPVLAIADASSLEGNKGMRAMSFTVSLSASSTGQVTVRYATGNGTATAKSDYTATSGTVTFAPGETAKTISVSIKGDRAKEPDEFFFVNLFGPANATILDGQAVGTIRNDDG